MPSDFDWRAEDDQRWDEYVASSPGSRARWLTQRRIVALLVVAGLVVVGGLIYWQLQDYVAETTGVVEEDLLSSHELVSQAAQSADPELLSALLSGRDPEWTQTQLALVSEGLLFDRGPLNLTLQPEESPEINIAVSPGLSEAELTVDRTFSFASGTDSRSEVTLRQVHVYRKSENRWLLSPPKEAFWGNWFTSRGRLISLTFPERDELLGKQLAADLEGTVNGACSALDLECPANLHLEVELTTDPAIWLAMIGSDARLEGGRSLTLPAPTLIGVPQDEDGYRALFRGYAVWVVSALIVEQIGWDCCEQTVLSQALIDAQLEQLGLQPWPLASESYRLAAGRPFSLETLAKGWDTEESGRGAVDRPEVWQAYALVEFLGELKGPGQSISGMERLLKTAGSAEAWLGGLEGATQSLQRLDGEWQRFLQRKYLLLQRGGPSPILPEEDVLLMCSDGRSGVANLYRYRPGEDTWSLALSDRDFVVMTGTPNDEGVFLVEQMHSNDELKTVFWDGENETIISQGIRFFNFSGLSDSTGKHLVFHGFDANTLSSEVFELDLDECEPGACDLTILPGSPIWSPDGQHLVLVPTTNEPPMLFPSGDLNGEGFPIEEGYGPFWLDGETVGYQRNRVDPEIVATTVEGFSRSASSAESTIELLVTADDLAELLVGIVTSTEQVELAINQVVYPRRGPRVLYIAAADRLEDRDYLFAYHWPERQLSLVLAPEKSYGGIGTLEVSPDGRWVTLTEVRSESFDYWHVLIMDVENGREAQIVQQGSGSPGTWSADGQWYMYLWSGALVFYSPEEDLATIAPSAFRDCTAWAWIEVR